jgi:hypothetical protein
MVAAKKIDQTSGHNRTIYAGQSVDNKGADAGTLALYYRNQ